MRPVTTVRRSPSARSNVIVKDMAVRKSSSRRGVHVAPAIGRDPAASPIQPPTEGAPSGSVMSGFIQPNALRCRSGSWIDGQKWPMERAMVR